MISITILISAQKLEDGLCIIRHFLCLMNFLAAFPVTFGIYIFPKSFHLRQQLLLAPFECLDLMVQQIRMQRPQGGHPSLHAPRRALMVFDSYPRGCQQSASHHDAFQKGHSLL